MENIYQVDVPIDDSGKDSLNRSKFVEILSESIKKYDADECLVIGIMGEWGCGKTSIINMVYNDLEKFNEERPENEKELKLINFNPWYFSNTNTIFIHFFDVLMENCNDENVEKEIFDCLSRLKDKLNNEVSLTQENESFNVYSKSQDKDLSMYQSFISLKNRLMKLFNESDFKIIISIDDIDRLTDKEMQQIFLLVKALADFPNIIYILSFDKNVVLKALNNLQVYSPEKFLEKIIQIPILVPEITKTRLDLLVEGELRPIYESTNKVNQENFNHIFSLLRPFFSNIRDLKRYTNLLRFYLNQFLDEINVGDYFIMIAIQLFEEEIYVKIKENKDLLTNNTFDKNLSEINSKVYPKLFDELNNPKKYDLDRFGSLLIYLFPILKDYNSEYKEYNEAMLGTNLNIASKLHFDKYFTFSIEENEISQILFEEVLKLKDVGEISKIFLKWVKENKTISLLDKLQNNTYNLNNEDSAYFIEALFLIGDNIKFISKLYETINDLFEWLFDGCESFRILKKVLKESESFYTCCYCLDKIGNDYNLYSGDESKSKNLPYIDPDQFKELKTIAHDRLIEWSENGKLINDVHFIYFLDFWKIFGTKEEVSEFIRLNWNDLDFIKIIDVARMDNDIIVDDNESFDEWDEFDFRRLFEYFHPSELEGMVTYVLSNNSLSKDEEQLCKSFLNKCRNETA